MKFQQETYASIRPDIEQLCARHWDEIALNKASIPLDPDWAKYEALDRTGILSVTTAREDEELKGYQVYIIMPHLHYKSSLTAISDVLYLAPECRQGMLGIKLMKHAEEALEARGVQRVIQNVKLHNDWGLILNRMGYTEIERIYSKLLKD